MPATPSSNDAALRRVSDCVATVPVASEMSNLSDDTQRALRAGDRDHVMLWFSSVSLEEATATTLIAHHCRRFLTQLNAGDLHRGVIS